MFASLARSQLSIVVYYCDYYNVIAIKGVKMETITIFISTYVFKAQA